MQTKICKCCGRELPLEAFAKQKLGKLGHTSKCKECKTNLYIRTKKGLIRSIYNQEKDKSKKRKYPLPTYSLEELEQWFWSQPNAETLYNNWVNSGYKQDLRPSIDRLDDYKSYTLDNIQLITYRENIDKYYKDLFIGKNNKICLAVDQYTLDGKFIKTYPSARIAARELGIKSSSNINNAAHNRKIIRKEKNGKTRITYCHKAAGFIWKIHKD